MANEVGQQQQPQQRRQRRSELNSKPSKTEKNERAKITTQRDICKKWGERQRRWEWDGEENCNPKKKQEQKARSEFAWREEEEEKAERWLRNAKIFKVESWPTAVQQKLHHLSLFLRSYSLIAEKVDFLFSDRLQAKKSLSRSRRADVILFWLQFRFCTKERLSD